jgi:hypothetical protein
VFHSAGHVPHGWTLWRLIGHGKFKKIFTFPSGTRTAPAKGKTAGQPEQLER